MQGMIILNETTRPVYGLNLIPLIIGVPIIIFLLAAAIRESDHILVTIGASILAVCVCLVTADFASHHKIGEKHIIEAYLDARADRLRIEQEYNVLEVRGKIYVLEKKEETK